MARPHDLVLIHFEDKPLVFARIEDIQPDAKPDWYHVKLLMLQLPLQVVTWILRDIYIEGAEFTMNGKRLRLEKVMAPSQTPATGESGLNPPHQTGKSGKVISLKDLKKSD
jgi:hypothetical protein